MAPTSKRILSSLRLPVKTIVLESALALGDSNTLRRDDPEIALFSAVKEDWHCASAVSLSVLLRRKCTSLLQDHS